MSFGVAVWLWKLTQSRFDASDVGLLALVVQGLQHLHSYTGDTLREEECCNARAD